MAKNKPSKKAFERRHSKERAFERYGVVLVDTDIKKIVKLIQSSSGRVVTLNKQSLRVSEKLVLYKDIKYRLLYDKIRKEIATFLPTSSRDKSQMKMPCASIKVNGSFIDANEISIREEEDAEKLSYRITSIPGFSKFPGQDGYMGILTNKDFTNLRLTAGDIIEIVDNFGIAREIKIIKVAPFNCFSFIQHVSEVKEETV